MLRLLRDSRQTTSRAIKTTAQAGRRTDEKAVAELLHFKKSLQSWRALASERKSLSRQWISP